MNKASGQFNDILQERKELIDQVIIDYFEQMEIPQDHGLQELKKSMEYSALRGGKRFRPALSLLISDAFGVAPQRILPFACAVELIHTYSLIHDDLPAMDNDDMRRGEPTNHKVFGESTALLAGDGLLTEAFVLLAHAFHGEPKLGIELVALLSKAAGIAGMVGGQAIDLRAKGNLPDIDNLTQMHEMKTGALIRVACEGAALACGLSQEKVRLARDFGAELGLAFQIKDDLLDSTDGKIEKGSFPDLIGIDKAALILDQISKRAHSLLDQMAIIEGPLHQIIDYNQSRDK